jgi:polyhydroxyalkanoate synthesis regulator phasin
MRGFVSVANTGEVEMTDQGKSENLSAEAKAVKAAIEHGENIRARVRKITLDALHRGKLDAQETRRVLSSVMQGASLGVSKAGDKTAQALGEALAGMDEALAKSAEAYKLALEEAAGRLRDFSRHDLEKAVNNLRTLESMLLDTLKEVADQSAGEAREIYQSLARHTKVNATSAGATASAAIASLEKKLGRTLREVAAAGSDVALSTTSKLADAAAGILAGLADALHDKAKSLREKKK